MTPRSDKLRGKKVFQGRPRGKCPGKRKGGDEKGEKQKGGGE